jgi:hypothetical protein
LLKYTSKKKLKPDRKDQRLLSVVASSKAGLQEGPGELPVHSIVLMEAAHAGIQAVRGRVKRLVTVRDKDRDRDRDREDNTGVVRDHMVRVLEGHSRGDPVARLKAARAAVCAMLAAFILIEMFSLAMAQAVAFQGLHLMQ